MMMNDVDLDELLECAEEDIQTQAFFASSVQLLGIVDNSIKAIDDRLLLKKKSAINPMFNMKTSGRQSLRNSHGGLLGIGHLDSHNQHR